MVNLPIGYPDKSPKTDLKNPRGLDDSILQCIKNKINTKIDNLVGEPVVFEIIEVNWYCKTENFYFFVIIVITKGLIVVGCEGTFDRK